MTQMTQNNITEVTSQMHPKAPILLCSTPHKDDMNIIGEYWFFSGSCIYKTFDSALRWVKRRHKSALITEYNGLSYHRSMFGAHPQNAYYRELHEYSLVDKHGKVVDTIYMCRSVIVYDAYKYSLKKWGGIL